MFRFLCIPLFLVVACGGKGPSIARFSANPTDISLGTNVILSWSVKGADSIEISGVGSVDTTLTTVTVRPEQTTTYVLTATGSGVTQKSAPVTVKVGSGADVRLSGYSAEAFTGTVVTARIRDSNGVPPSADTEIQVAFPSGDGDPLTLACPGGAAGCYAVFPAIPPVGGNYATRVTIEGVERLSSTAFQAEGLPIPAVTASRSGAQTIQASWIPVPGAKVYRVLVRNLDARSDFTTVLTTTSTSATLSTPPLQAGTNYAVLVEAFGFDPDHPAPGDVTGGTPISRGDAFLPATTTGWTLYTPADFSGSTLTATYPGMATGERLAVLTLNLTKTDGATAGVTVTNAAAPPASSIGQSGQSSALSDGTTRRSLHDAVRDWEREVIENMPALQTIRAQRKPAAAPTLAAVSTSFCVHQGTSNSVVRRNATLKSETAHALFYVDDADAADYSFYEPGIWTTLANLWDGTIYPEDTSTFGTESDVDQNGKLIVFFTSELGPAQNNAILLGYYYAGDVVFPKDSTPACSQGATNGADMFFMNGIANVLPRTSSTPTQNQIDEVIQGTYPDTLAHEFQHLINFNQHFLVQGTPSAMSEDTWINEGLSVTAEDLSGFGWNRQAGRHTAALYMNRNDDALLRYTKASLTLWEADPIGNYEGSHTYFRLWADQRTPSALGDLVKTRNIGIGNVERVLGIPFQWAFAQWTTALMFSNETFSPGPTFNYTGAVWTPLHQKIASYDTNNVLTRQGYLRYAPLGPAGATATLRTNGYNAFLTGAPLTPGDPVTLTVTSNGIVPHVVVYRFTGDLPPGVPVH